MTALSILDEPNMTPKRRPQRIFRRDTPSRRRQWKPPGWATPFYFSRKAVAADDVVLWIQFVRKEPHFQLLDSKFADKREEWIDLISATWNLLCFVGSQQRWHDVPPEPEPDAVIHYITPFNDAPCFSARMVLRHLAEAEGYCNKKVMEREAGTLAPPSDQAELPKVNAMEQGIINVIGDRRLTGPDIHKVAGGKSESYTKGVLSSLRKRNILDNLSPGYTLTPLGQRLRTSRP